MVKRRQLLCSLVACSCTLAATSARAQSVSSDNPHYDVIVVGSGAAGLSAAVSAAENGARRVLVLEKATTLGGHTIVSTGYVSALNRKRLSLEEYAKSAEVMIEGMRKAADGRGNPDLARKIVSESADIMDWLASMGLKWEHNVFQTLAGLAPLSYVSSSVRAGYDYITTLNKRARALGVEVLFSTRATQLHVDEHNRIVGLSAQKEFQTMRFDAPAVVLATGGYGGNVAMRSRYVPWLDSSYPTTADPYFSGTDCATGDGIEMGSQLGAMLTDMDCIMVIPFWGGRLTDYVGADIYLDFSGRRFVNEGSSWNIISNAIRKLPNEECWVITDSQSLQGASRSTKIMNGVVKSANTIAEMAEGMNVKESVLTHTLERYNSFVRSGIDEDFGKNMFTQEINRPPYFYGKERLYVHYCCGGLQIDSYARVLDVRSKPILGLFAAGETTGGIHGRDRLGGCSLTDCFVFGRQAGKSGALYSKRTRI